MPRKATQHSIVVRRPPTRIRINVCVSVSSPPIFQHLPENLITRHTVHAATSQQQEQGYWSVIITASRTKYMRNAMPVDGWWMMVMMLLPPDDDDCILCCTPSCSCSSSSSYCYVVHSRSNSVKQRATRSIVQLKIIPLPSASCFILMIHRCPLDSSSAPPYPACTIAH